MTQTTNSPQSGPEITPPALVSTVEIWLAPQSSSLDAPPAFTACRYLRSYLPQAFDESPLEHDLTGNPVTNQTSLELQTNELLERIFATLNGRGNPATGRGWTERSLSVHDVVRLVGPHDVHSFQCAAQGWRTLDLPRAQVEFPACVYLLGTRWCEDVLDDTLSDMVFTRLNDARRALEDWVLERTEGQRDITEAVERNTLLKQAKAEGDFAAFARFEEQFYDEDDGAGYLLTELERSGPDGDYLESYRLLETAEPGEPPQTRFRAWIKKFEYR